MKKYIARLVSTAFLTALCAGTAAAMPAYPYPMEMEQPDGSKVTLQLCGDEYFHYFRTTDGLIAGQDADGWYRLVDNAGELTDIPALEVSQRSSAYSSRLAGMDGATAFRHMKSKADAASPRMQYRMDRAVNSPARAASRATAYEPRWDNSDGHYLRTFPAEGKQKVLVILVSFRDKDWSFCADPGKEMQRMLQEPGYSNYDCTGSAFDYFKESSRGAFQPQFDVYGPVKLPNAMSYYGGNDSYGNDMHPEMMVVHACELLDSEINFADYDRDGDGVVDNIYIFYAGYGENEGASSSTVWPHSWDIRYAGGGTVIHDGVEIGHYACSNELTLRGNEMTGIGTFCHEFSHVLGLPDLYATTYTSAHTPGEYSLMDHGSYNNNGRTPPIYSGYERYALEWQAPYMIRKGEDIRTRGLTDGGNFYKMCIDAKRPTEYFLFENRQPIGNDVTTPGHGLLVWHIDYKASVWESNRVNNTPNDQCVDIVEADGSASDGDMDGDTFPGTDNVTSFTADTRPAFANKSGTKSSLGIYDITNGADGIVSFRVGEGMNEDSDYPCQTPFSRLVSTGADNFTVSFSSVSPAARDKNTAVPLYVSVESLAYDDDAEAFVSKPLEGYSLRRVLSDSSLRVEGTSPSGTYRVKTYRQSEANLSAPHEITVFTGGETATDTKAQISADAVRGNDARLSWSAVDNADHYLLTVATRREQPSTDGVSVDFSGTPRVPEGWSLIGVYSSQAGNFGTAAPSLYLSYGDDYLWTAEYPDNEIESVEMWLRKNNDTGVGLDIYSCTGSGLLAHLATVADLTTAGKNFSVENLPEGVHSLVFLVHNPNGTRVFIDDIKLNFRGETTDTPVGIYDDLPVYETSAFVTDLDLSTDYVAYVRAHDGEKGGIRSNAVSFTTTDVTGVESVSGQSVAFRVEGGSVVASDASVAFDIYRMDGTAVALGVSGSYMLPARGVYVVSAPGLNAKVIY